MVQFMELIISGQKKLRELLQVQNEEQKNKEKAKKLLSENLSELETFTIQAVEEDGKEILLQCMILYFIVFHISDHIFNYSYARWNIVFS